MDKYGVRANKTQNDAVRRSEQEPALRHFRAGDVQLRRNAYPTESGSKPIRAANLMGEQTLSVENANDPARKIRLIDSPWGEGREQNGRQTEGVPLLGRSMGRRRRTHKVISTFC